MTESRSTGSTNAISLAVAAATGAACATALLGGLIYNATFVRSPGDLLDPSFYAATLYVGGVAAMVAAVICPLLFVVIGLPLHALSRRHHWVGVWAYASVGLAISSVAAIAAVFAFPLDRDLAMPLTIVGGTVATLAFWIVARPDKSLLVGRR